MLEGVRLIPLVGVFKQRWIPWALVILTVLARILMLGLCIAASNNLSLRMNRPLNTNTGLVEVVNRNIYFSHFMTLGYDL